MTWKTKPSDRFVLRFIKTRLSAPISRALVRVAPGVPPLAITLTGTCVGIAGGAAYGLGHAVTGALLAAAAQVLDGVDGQVARLTQRESAKGAFLDSVLDRVVDFAMLFGMILYCLRHSAGLELGGFVLSENWIIVIACLAAIGISQVSYATARAAALKLDYRRPEYAGKGTRTAVIVLCGLLTAVWVHFPLIALLYIAIHPNLAVLSSLAQLRGGSDASRNL
jgi:phosphatidylglycerophosphate synthase